MDLYAFVLMRDERVSEYIQDHYGEVPRIRGVRFMKVEQRLDDANCDEEDMFNRYVGQDVIYIHTRCGDCGTGYEDEDSNYIYCGGKEWEEEHSDLFLDHITEDYDRTYCDHYFKAVVDDKYNEIIKLLSEGNNERV